MTHAASLSANNLRVVAGHRCLLDAAHFEIQAGHLTVLIGVSGSGKSTLLRILSGLEEIDDLNSGIRWSGQLTLAPQDTRQRLGLVFQQPALLDELTPQQNVQLAIDHRWSPKLSGIHSPPDSQTEAVESQQVASEGKEEHLYHSAIAKQWLEYLHVPEGVRVSRLSGGQRQRLSLAQSLAGQPTLLIYDEPTTGLDAINAERVAQLIGDIQVKMQITSLVVTHDYESFLPVADHVLILDSTQHTLQSMPNPSVEKIRDEMQRQVALLQQSSPRIDRPEVKPGIVAWTDRLLRGLEAIGMVVQALLAGLITLIPRWTHIGWGLRFLLHYLRLVTGVTAIIYLMVSGLIVGFVGTYFTLKHMPFKVYTEPLLMEEMLAAIGFALYRIFIPVLTTLLIAARCAASVSADLGNKRYGGQIETMQMLQVHPQRYLGLAVMWSFLIGALLLNQVAWYTAKSASLMVHLSMQPDLGPYYWDTYFHQTLRTTGRWSYEGLGWVVIKLLACAFGTGVLTYALAMRPKQAATEVSRSITTTILWSTLWVLFVHMLVAMMEFNG